MSLFFNESSKNIIRDFFLNNAFKWCTLSRNKWCTLPRNGGVVYSGIFSIVASSQKPFINKQIEVYYETILKLSNQNIYKKIFWIDEYIQIYFPVSQKFLGKKYSDKNEGNYGNLWVKSKINLNDKIGQFKDFWLKKLIKRILRKAET